MDIAIDEKNESDVRRSGRKRNSRIMIIDGETVLKTNNYTLKEGLISEKQWSDGALNSHENVENLNVNSKKRVLKQLLDKSENANDVSGKEHKVKKVDVDSASYSIRVRNEIIKANIVKNSLRRKEFLRSNWRLLAPFLDTTTQSCPPPCDDETKDDIEKHKYPALLTQPKCLQNVEMRDYQLEGLNWVSQEIFITFNMLHYLNFYSITCL